MFYYMSPKGHNNYSKFVISHTLGLKIMKLFSKNSLIKGFPILPSSVVFYFWLNFYNVLINVFWKILEIFLNLYSKKNVNNFLKKFHQIFEATKLKKKNMEP
jgi:hypothetical protein